LIEQSPQTDGHMFAGMLVAGFDFSTPRAKRVLPMK
jgi:hypothetical protein